MSRKQLIIKISFFLILLSYGCNPSLQKSNTESVIQTTVPSDQSINANKDEISRNYEEILGITIRSIIENKSLSIDEVEASIPRSEEEYLIFYSFTEQDSLSNNSLLELNSIIQKSSEKNNLECLRRYLMMSEFVDGEFAEGYFEDVDVIISKNKESFCELFSDYGEKNMSRLREFHLEYCK